ncbi:hypothetical protein [Achromobacter insolitus]|uniref:hypothetical protein n=1 Tax=Achromobacter insolitus TaxID=217204 RepID=UPI0028A95CA1|nr:hypothetical protein [Achromobacter insolitus]
MRITNDWLLQWQTPKGGYKKRQLALIDVPWPPRRGWKYDVIGTEIPDETARAFEQASGRQSGIQMA